MAAELKRLAEEELAARIALDVKRQMEVGVAVRLGHACCSTTGGTGGTQGPGWCIRTSCVQWLVGAHVRLTSTPPGPACPGPRCCQAEAAAKAKAKEDLKAFLLSNEVNKKASLPGG